MLVTVRDQGLKNIWTASMPIVSLANVKEINDIEYSTSLL